MQRIVLIIALVVVAALLVLFISSRKDAVVTPVVTTPATPEVLKQSFCENDWAANPTRCPAGKNILVKKMLYSRPALQPCMHANASANVTCAGKDYTAKAQTLASGSSLVWAQQPNAALGEDPCPGVYKQIDIEYSCQ